MAANEELAALPKLQCCIRSAMLRQRNLKIQGRESPQCGP